MRELLENITLGGLVLVTVAFCIWLAGVAYIGEQQIKAMRQCQVKHSYETCQHLLQHN